MHATKRTLILWRYYCYFEKKNEMQSAICRVKRSFDKNLEIVIQEIVTSQLGCYHTSDIVKLKESWCDCGEFQVL